MTSPQASNNSGTSLVQLSREKAPSRARIDSIRRKDDGRLHRWTNGLASGMMGGMETQAKLSLAQLRSATRSLSSEERGILLDDLIVGLNELESSEDPSAVETAWKEEIARRADRVERGEAIGIPAADVKSRLRERLPWLK